MSNISNGKDTSNEGHSGNDSDRLDDVGSVSFDSDGGEGDEGFGFVDAGVGEESVAADEDLNRAKLRLVEQREFKGDKAAAIRHDEPNLLKRARALAGDGLISFPDEKMIRSGDQIVMQAMPTDENRWTAFDALFGDDDDDTRPHIDTFRGRFVDWKGRIVDDRYSMVELVKAIAQAGLKGHSADQVRKAFKEWGMRVQHNDLIRKFESKIPQWDGVARMEGSLIELFKCFDTPLNREFAKYFWLSLYCRVIDPGCLAPMALSLFGAQNAGKSYFTRQICQIILDDKDADTVQLNLGGNDKDFLRMITGNSVIANVGEMVGFDSRDLRDIKNFMTRVSDNMDYKYEGNFVQKRQWIVVMDGNKYEGMQRDDTGNRRFYPMFVGQLPDENGQPAWASKYSADFTGFIDKVWQIMAECRAWVADNGGIKGYEKFVDTVSKSVAEFSRKEMASDRGTIKDESLEVFLKLGLLKCKFEPMNGTKHKGLWVSSGAVSNNVKTASRGSCIVKFNHLKPKMAALGAEYYPNGMQGYLFRDIMDEAELKRQLRGGVHSDAALGLDDDDDRNGGF